MLNSSWKTQFQLKSPFFRSTRKEFHSSHSECSFQCQKSLELMEPTSRRLEKILNKIIAYLSYSFDTRFHSNILLFLDVLGYCCLLLAQFEVNPNFPKFIRLKWNKSWRTFCWKLYSIVLKWIFHGNSLFFPNCVKNFSVGTSDSLYNKYRFCWNVIQSIGEQIFNLDSIFFRFAIPNPI